MTCAVPGSASSSSRVASSCLEVFFKVKLLRSGRCSVTFSYPSPLETFEDLKRVEMFCFVLAPPVGGNLYSRQTFDSSTFIIVLTNEIGRRLYCHALTTVDPSDGCRETLVAASRFPWVCFFREILYTYYRQTDKREQITLLEMLHSTPLSPPTHAFPSAFRGRRFIRPADTWDMRFSDCDANILLAIMSDSQILRVVAALLLEQNVVVCGPDFGIVTRVMMALQSILCPFEWQHILITVITPELVSVLGAPSPFFVGITQRQRAELFSSVELAPFVLVDINVHAPPKGGWSMFKSALFLSPGSVSGYRCRDIEYHGVEAIQLPQAVTGTSTLRMTMLGLRAGVSDNFSTSDGGQLSRVLWKYYAQHLSIVGSTVYKTQGEQLQKALERHKSPRSAVFYNAFLNSQCAEVLAVQMRQMFADDSFVWDQFCVKSVQQNPDAFADVILRCNCAVLNSVGSPVVQVSNTHPRNGPGTTQGDGNFGPCCANQSVSVVGEVDPRTTRPALRTPPPNIVSGARFVSSHGNKETGYRIQ